MARSLLTFAVLAPVLIVSAREAAANETRCVRGDDAIRRIAIETEAADRNVPCEVVYWKDTEQPGVRNVLWTAQTDADFCARKAEELVDTLKGAGWDCAATDAVPGSPGRQARPATAAGAPVTAERPVTAEDQPGAPVTAERPMAAEDQPAPSARPEAVEDRSPAPSQDTDSEDGAVRTAMAPERDEAELDDDASDDATARTALDAIIEQNLVRLNDGVDGRFAAEIADYGDLDGDGLADGLVFFTYESQRLGKARFVAAYLFDGESYALAATKPLAGSEDSVHSAEIESIQDGVISLRLNVLEPGDASCCPSGLRRQSLMLRGGQLVEARSASTAEGRS